MAWISCGHCGTKHRTKFDVYQCSLKAYGRRSQAPTRAQAVTPPKKQIDPLAYPFSAPEAMTTAIRDGLYAVDIGTVQQYVIFVRISRPLRGKLAGCFKIQTQHGDRYAEAAVKYPSGSWRVFTNRKADLDKALLTICVNPLDAAVLYAKEKGRCFAHGGDLTDERSRYYGIGPECVKSWPDYVNKVHEERGIWTGEKGPYQV